ncbi:MAG: hypothetical protein ACRD0O_12605 [Acidimicrobiia bacterium]
MLGFMFKWFLAGAVAGVVIATGIARVGSDPGIEVRAGGAGGAGMGLPPEAPGEAGRIVWAEAGDIWLYESATGKRRQLTDGDGRSEYLPRFHGPDRVTFVAADDRPANDFRPGAGTHGSVIHELDLTTGRRSELVRLAGGVVAHDWTPDGRTLALYVAGDDHTSSELHVFTGGHPRLIRRFGPVRGRGGFINYDEWRVEWSPDGRRLLVVDTGLDTSEPEDTFFVLDTDGTDVMAPRGGTWARWGADSQTVYCICAVRPGDDNWVWLSLHTGTGVGTPLLLERAMRPSVSPDGRFLAFDDGQDTPTVHVLELRPGSRPRRVTGGAIAPLWLDGGRLAVTDTRPCPDTPDECMAGGHGSMFHSAGTASAVDVTSGDRAPIPPLDTDDADVAYPSG